MAITYTFGVIVLFYTVNFWADRFEEKVNKIDDKSLVLLSDNGFIVNLDKIRRPAYCFSMKSSKLA